MTYLLSYPRSGNTYLRYIIELLSKRPTLGCRKNGNDIPIHKISNNSIKIENEDPILRKEHFWKEVSGRLGDGGKLIVLVRDYKECITSHLKRQGKNNRNEFVNELNTYMTNLEKYDECGRDKLLIYYEDLIKNPKYTLKPIFEFLNIEDSDIEGFVENRNFYKKESEKNYFASVNSKHDTSFHRQKMNSELRKKLDELTKNKNEEIYNKYLTKYEVD